MAGKLSFSIALNLLTENFKAGTNNVKNGLRSMQMQVLTFAAALGAGGLGLESFVSRLIETARETSRVTTALKNVSGTGAEYAKSQKFLIDLAQKYGIEVLALTGNFSKFTAAAQQTGMSMDNQKKIFESMSRASAAFGMSAEDTNLSFLAITQMMSKGKISSEELRRQLGERLPIAMSAMAKAAGVPIQKLDKLLQQGELMSADVLPRFADALNSMIKSVNTDNAETSVNRLKNAFTEFTQKTSVQSMYKSLIDSITQLVKSGADNIGQIVNASIAVIVGLLGGKLFRWITTELAKAQKSAMYAAARSAKAAGVAFDEVAWKAQSASVSMRTAFTRAGAAIKGAMISIMPTAIIMGITYLIAELIRISEETERIKSIFSDYKTEAASVSHTPEIIQLQVLQGIINDTNKSTIQRKNALDKVNDVLGTHLTLENASLSNNLKINSVINDRIKLLEATAKVDFYTRKKIEAEDKRKSLLSSLGGHKELKKGLDLTDPTAMDWFFFPVGIQKKIKNKELENKLHEYIELTKIMNDSDVQIKANIGLIPPTKKMLPYASDEKKHKETDLEKAENKYAHSLAELDAKVKLKIISSDEYDKAVDELNKSALVEAMSLKDNAAKGTKYLSNLQSKVAHPRFNMKQSKLNTAFDDYKSSKRELDNKRAAGDAVMTQEEYNTALNDLIKSTLSLTGSIMGADAKATELYNQLLIDRKEAAPLVLDKRDKTFDYKKSKSEIANDELEVAKANLDKMKEYAKANAVDLTEQITASTKNVTNLSDALKIQQVKDDINDLQEQLSKGLYSGVKDVASSADRMVSSFKNLSDVFSDVDASGWERIMAIWSAMTNAVDGILSILDMIENFTKLTNELAAAKEAEAIVDTAVTGTKVANSAAEATAAGTAAIASSAAVTTAATTAATASTIQMAAESTAAYAAIPFAGVGLAAAQIAAMKGMIAAAALPCFENGGIVGGSSYSGDKILARLNSGEMILNKGQQATMYSLLSNGNGGSSSTSSETRIRGCDIYLALKNYIKQTGKKL